MARSNADQSPGRQSRRARSAQEGSAVTNAVPDLQTLTSNLEDLQRQQIASILAAHDYGDFTSRGVVPLPPDYGRSGVPQDLIVRRPIFGLDPTPEREAFMQIVVQAGDNQQIEFFNSSAKNGRATANSNFIIVSAARQDTDSVAQQPTFRRWYTYTIGKNAVVLQVNGILFESDGFPWVSEFIQNYNKYLNPSALIANNALVYLTIDGHTYKGLIFGVTLAKSAAESIQMAQLSFQMMVEEEELDVNRDFESSTELSPAFRFYSKEYEQTWGFPPEAAELLTEVFTGFEQLRGPSGQNVLAADLQITGPTSVMPIIYPPDVNRALRQAAYANQTLGYTAYDLNDVRRGVVRAYENYLASVGSLQPLGGYFFSSDPQDQIFANQLVGAQNQVSSWLSTYGGSLTGVSVGSSSDARSTIRRDLPQPNPSGWTSL
jgi:hypothetical protein